MWRNSYPEANRNTIAHNCKTKNSLWAGARKLPHLTNPLVDAPSSPDPPYSPEEFKEMKRAATMALTAEQQAGGIPVAVQIEAQDPVRHILRANNGVSKKQRLAILHWICGAVVRKWAPCKHCQIAQPSRKHALECSGALAFLQEKFPDEGLDENHPTQTVLDQLLNKYRNSPPDQVPFYNYIHNAITLVYQKVLGFRQRENGYWEPDDEDERAEERLQALPPAQRRRVDAQGRGQTLPNAQERGAAAQNDQDHGQAPLQEQDQAAGLADFYQERNPALNARLRAQRAALNRPRGRPPGIPRRKPPSSSGVG